MSKNSYFANFGQIKNKFTDFEQVKKIKLYCWLWTRVKLNPQQNSLGRNRIPKHVWGHYLVSPALHPGFSDPRRSPPALTLPRHKAIFILFFECLGNQFFDSLTCELPDAMLRRRSLTLLLSRETRDFPKVRGILSMFLRSHT